MSNATRMRMRSTDFVAAIVDDGPPTLVELPLRGARDEASIDTRILLEVSLGALRDEVFFGATVRALPGDRRGRAVMLAQLEPGSEARVRFVRRAASSERPPARQHRRYPSDLALVWSTEERRGFGRLADISLGGAFVVSKRLPSDGERVQLELRTDAGRAHLSLPSEVRWTRPDGFGVAFDGTANRGELRALVRQHAR